MTKILTTLAAFAATVMIAPVGTQAVATPDPDLILDPATKGEDAGVITEAWLDPAALLADLAPDGLVLLPLGGFDLTLDLVPHDMRAPDHRAWLVDADGVATEVETGFLGTYKGHLAAVDASESRVTLVPGYLNAYVEEEHLGLVAVETALPRVADADGRLLHVVRWIPAGLPEHDHEGEGLEDSSKDPKSDPLVGGLSEYLTLPELGFETEVPGTGRCLDGGEGSDGCGGGGRLNFRAGLDSDGEFYFVDTGTLWSRQAAVLNNAEGMYSKQVDVEFDIAAQYSWIIRNGPSSTKNCDSLLNDFSFYWKRDRTHVSRSFVVALTERNIDGDTIGCAWQPGIHNPTQRGYGIVQTWDQDGTWERKTAEHEIGHMFYGMHEKAKKWRDPGCLWFCTKSTIMYPTLSGGTQDKFSSGSDKNANSWRVRTCAEKPSSCGGMAT